MNHGHEETVQKFSQRKGKYRDNLHDQASNDSQNIILDEYLFPPLSDDPTSEVSSHSFSYLRAEVYHRIVFPSLISGPPEFSCEN